MYTPEQAPEDLTAIPRQRKFGNYAQLRIVFEVIPPEDQPQVQKPAQESNVVEFVPKAPEPQITPPTSPSTDVEAAQKSVADAFIQYEGLDSDPKAA